MKARERAERLVSLKECFVDMYPFPIARRLSRAIHLQPRRNRGGYLKIEEDVFEEGGSYEDREGPRLGNGTRPGNSAIWLRSNRRPVCMVAERF